MISIGLLTWAEERYASYSIAGLFVACFTVGYAAGAIALTRLFRLVSSLAVLRIAAVASATLMLLLVAVDWSLIGGAICTVLVGMTFPPVTPLARALYARAFEGAQRTKIYSLDSIAQEFIWIIAPLLAVVCAAAWGPAFVIVVSAFCVFVGTLGFTLLRLVHRYARPIVRPAHSGPVRLPGALFGLFLIGFFLVGSGSFIEVVVIERFGYHGMAAGVILAFIAGGSVLGGLLVAKRPVRRYSLVIRLGLTVAGLLGAAVSPSPILFGVSLCISGCGIAPSFAAIHGHMAALAQPHQAAEVYAFANTVQLIGMAAGAGVAGLLVTEFPSAVAMYASAACAAVAALLALWIEGAERPRTR